MTSVALEELVVGVLDIFFESNIVLGCPEDEYPMVWFTSLSAEEKIKVGGRLLEIIEKELK